MCSLKQDLITRNLNRCLASLTKQYGVGYEIILVLDNYLDYELEQFHLINKNIRILSSNERRGTACARRIGAENAIAQIIAYIDDDCIADQKWASNIVSAFLKNEKLVAIGGTTLPYKDGSLMSEFCELDKTQRAPLCNNDGSIRCISTVNGAFRRFALFEVNFFTSAYEYAYNHGLYFVFEDYDITQRLAAIYGNNALRYVPEVIVYHHNRPTWIGRLRQVIQYGKGAAFWCWTYKASPKCLEPKSTIPINNYISYHFYELVKCLPRYIAKWYLAKNEHWPFWKASFFGLYCYSLRISFHIGYYVSTVKLYRLLGAGGIDDLNRLNRDNLS